MRYFLWTEASEQGPLTEEEIVGLLERGNARDALVRSENGGDWVDIRSYRAFREALPTERPPPGSEPKFEPVAAVPRSASRLRR